MILQKRLDYIRKCIVAQGESSNNRQYNLNSSENLDTILDEQGPGYIECLENVDFACESDPNDHSILVSNAIENCLNNDANVTDINGISNTEDLSEADKSDEPDFDSDDSVKDPNFRHRSASISSTDSSSSSSSSSSNSSSSSSASSTRSHSAHRENIPPALHVSSIEVIPPADSQVENLDLNKKTHT
ncbi:unnamed protein product [Parnassius mnemosyne]|uniref:Uncharacterized protein n=1 Tax=Parnassius mnemosyne TaxID=213953 RepID=A0AAV1KKE6_9NEOP